MKKLYIVLIILNFQSAFCQNFTIPEITFQGTNDTLNYTQVLKLKDSSALIIKAGYASYWYGGTSADFIIYNNDGSILKYTAFFPVQGKIKVSRKKVKKKKYIHYRQFLNECITNNLFAIDTSKLNIEKWINKDGSISKKIVYDAVNASFEIIRGNKYSYFSSYAADVYIKNEVPGFEERKKLVYLLNKFNAVFNK